MRLLISIGYTHLLFSKAANYSAIIEAVAEAQAVTESGYGDTKLYTPDPNQDIGCLLIADTSTKLTDGEKQSPLLDRLLAAEAEKQKLNLENYNLKAKLKKVEDAGKTLDTALAV